jgi:predicted transcriptional regulator
MGKQVNSPRYNIISMRVNDEERDLLQHVATQLSINMSEMMRRAMQHLNVESDSMQLNRGD